MDWALVWTILGGMFGIVALNSGLMYFLVTRIENRLDSHITDSQENFRALTARIDATGARIDATQAIIMRMLEKRGM